MLERPEAAATTTTRIPLYRIRWWAYLTVGSTIFEMWLGQGGSPRSATIRLRQGAMGAGAHADGILPGQPIFGEETADAAGG